MLTRRHFLVASVAGLTACSQPRLLLRKNVSGTSQQHYTLVAREAPISIVPGTTSPGMAFNGGYPAPIIRVKQNEPVRIDFINQLKEPSTVHWHGIRIDNRMDGVPHLTQQPVMPGEQFSYEFICPDAGTFWYHPHINSLQQLGRGLTGLLIVEEATPTKYQTDICVEMRDWHIADDGNFLPMSNPRQAARMGTLGNVKTINAKDKPVIEVPAGQLTRLRLANIDNTRVYTVSLKNYPAQKIALDGFALRETRVIDDEALGAGMRMDLGLVAPTTVGEETIVYDKKGRLYFELFRLRTVPSDKPAFTGSIPALPAHTIAVPDINNAEEKNFVFEWAGAVSPADSDGNVKSEFWTINKRAWPGDSHDHLPEPLAILERGKTYIFNLHNATPHHHPIHMHGYGFTVLASDKRAIKPYQADTILLQRNERARIAFVADNPGRWMYHCHVIEHMMTGLMGYITVV